MTQWLDSDAVQAVAGQTIMFSFWFYPESVASDSSQNNARAEIYYEYSGGSNTFYGPWVAPTELNWRKAYVAVNLPSTITAVKVIVHGKPDFKAWIDFAQLTTVTVTPPDTSALYSYSTDYEFVVPEDGDRIIRYPYRVEVFIWDEWDNQYFGFKADEVDDLVSWVKIDGALKYLGSDQYQPVSIDLGPLSAGYHTLEFYFWEIQAAGKVKFCVALNGDPNQGKAALTRFHVDIPDYGDTEHRYTMKTTTYFAGDYFFLGGYADDFIDDVWVDAGLIWQDWMWDMGAYGAIYAWGDGFMYPLDWQYGWHTITFTFGEIWGAGQLDFQYSSWTNQQDKIGAPKFRAVGNAIPANYITFNSAMFYGGSKWKFEADPEFSERYFEARGILDVNYNDGHEWFNTVVEIGLGLGWAEWALLPATEDDVGITLNLTATHFSPISELPIFRYDLVLRNLAIDIYSFPASEIKGIEYQEHDSFVKPDLTSAIDYTGTVIMFVSSTFENPIGAITGLSIKGLAAITKIIEGQRVSRFNVNTAETHHYRVLRSDNLVARFFPESTIKSQSDAIFFKLNPAAGKHCGLTEVVLQGTLEHQLFYCESPENPMDIYSIADITITVVIPWFIRG